MLVAWFDGIFCTFGGILLYNRLYIYFVNSVRLGYEDFYRCGEIILTWTVLNINGIYRIETLTFIMSCKIENMFKLTFLYGFSEIVNLCYTHWLMKNLLTPAHLEYFCQTTTYQESVEHQIKISYKFAQKSLIIN